MNMDVVLVSVYEEMIKFDLQKYNFSEILERL